MTDFLFEIRTARSCAIVDDDQSMASEVLSRSRGGQGLVLQHSTTSRVRYREALELNLLL